MTEKFKKWLHEGEYLPACMKDFHDQKDLFKLMHSHWGKSFTKDEYVSKITWVPGCVYVISYFLWFMALHGYKLQKTRKKLVFCDLDESLATFEKRNVELLGEILKK